MQAGPERRTPLLNRIVPIQCELEKPPFTQERTFGTTNSRARARSPRAVILDLTSNERPLVLNGALEAIGPAVCKTRQQARISQARTGYAKQTSINERLRRIR
ncbi:hypothetical protein WN72_33155 [Bradyrhizobium arachidis]|uniref:Uncharacterized protein n=1 Tax=Bradyrhizobium arachidis TaxID=858423 RepID=A0AAE7TK17_9BRAD|nr:hypothetical protein WN72_33155 [Bradyrhizobium arachidis]